LAYNQFSTVNTIIGKVSTDLRNQLSALSSSATQTTQQSILIDYVNRTHKQMLRFSRWGFLLSEVQYFMTSFGQTDYWLGPVQALPPSMVDTGLHLSDVDKIKNDEVRDFSNDRTLKPMSAQPLGPNLNFRSGQTRTDRPRTFYQDWNDPNILHIWPGADNQNPYQPIPEPPFLLNTTQGGSLPQRTYYVVITFVDSIGGESTPSSTSTFITIPANHLMTVVSPTLPFAKTSSGVIYQYYNVYAAQSPALNQSAEGSETLQTTFGTQLMGANWTEPTSGLTTSGVSAPTSNTIAQMGGYVIGFRYYKSRIALTTLNQTLQVPDDYDDIVVQGVQYLGWKLLGKADLAQASYSAYKAGLTEMIADKNLFPDNDFIRPDSGSHVNQQILSYLPPFFIFLVMCGLQILPKILGS
jgi:hypothetical protein